jgi:putative DNA primase/helicase
MTRGQQSVSSKAIIERIVDEAELALIAANRGLYQRDGRIVCAVSLAVLTAKGLKVAVQRIAERGDHALCEDLASAANFVKWDGRARAHVTVSPPMWVVRTLRQRTGRLRFPVLTGIINAPTMRADGSILDPPGYDDATGLLYDPVGVEFPAVPGRPTRDEALAAMALLDDLISTFPFVEGADRSVALSAILTALVRRSLPTAPLHAFTAPVVGSGKSMLVDIASLIATGHEAPVLGPGQDEGEFEKRLGSVLLAGDPIVSLDNCERPLGGRALVQNALANAGETANFRPIANTRIDDRSIRHRDAQQPCPCWRSHPPGTSLPP